MLPAYHNLHILANLSLLGHIPNLKRIVSMVVYEDAIIICWGGNCCFLEENPKVAIFYNDSITLKNYMAFIIELHYSYNA